MHLEKTGGGEEWQAILCRHLGSDSIRAVQPRQQNLEDQQVTMHADADEAWRVFEVPLKVPEKMWQNGC